MTFKISTVTVRITWHFLAVITFMLSLQTGTVLYAVLFSMLHELGHLACMLALGNKPQCVSFELTGINIIRNDSTTVSLTQEIFTAVSGPLVNLILFLLFALLWGKTGEEKFLSMASVNLILMTFNLLPIKGLDGGKVLYYFISKFISFKAAKTVLTVSSVVFVILMFSYGIYVLYLTRYNFSMLIIALMLSLSIFSKEEC